VTEQLLELEVTPASEQLVVPNTPAPELAKTTVPVGAEAPVPDVSLTVAVQVVGWPPVAGEAQLTVVLESRLFTVTEAVPLLARCVLLPP